MKLNLKALRKQKGMTQGKLAEMVGATTRQIGAWERGENELTLDYASAIADVLDCSIDDIANRDSYSNIYLNTLDEHELVVLFRMLPIVAKRSALAAFRTYLEVGE